MFGPNGDDLKIFHSTNGIFSVNTGNAYFRNTGDFSSTRYLYLMAKNDEQSITCKSDGGVEVYYDNSKKLETTSSGVSVTGGITSTGGVTTGGELNLESPNNSNTSRYIDCGLGDNNALYIRGLSSGANHEVLAYFARGGAVGLYYDNSQKLYTQSWGAGVTGDVRPSTGAIYDLGTSSYRWRNVYTSDLSLSNEAIGGNDIDGTWGDWTIQEGESDLFLKNNRSGKKYKFNLTEVS